MARDTSSIDNHPQRQQIIDGILAGLTLNAIAQRTNPPVSPAAIQRYKQKVAARGAEKESHLDASGSVSKRWAEAELIQIVAKAQQSARPESLNVARGAIMDLAKLNGWEAPRRTESAVLNVHAVAPGQLAQQLSAMFSALPEHERRALAASEPAIAAEFEPTE